MNMCGIFAFFAAVFMAMVAALPTLDDVEVHDWQLNIKEESELVPALKDEPEETGVRLARATCDLLSVSTPIGSLGHSACAAHCLAMRRGFRGGRCRDGVCHCRR